jgi:hypothetical protein
MIIRDTHDWALREKMLNMGMRRRFRRRHFKQPAVNRYFVAAKESRA